MVSTITSTKNPTMSLKVKYGWKGILSMSLFTPKGLFDPVWCKNSRWIRVAAATMKGNKKWKVKKRVRVALSTAKPPHTHWTKSTPRYGTADNKFVITVAPQNDICPQGSTYPIKAVPMTKNKMITPTIHVCRYM